MFNESWIELTAYIALVVYLVVCTILSFVMANKFIEKGINGQKIEVSFWKVWLLSLIFVFAIFVLPVFILKYIF